MFPTWRTSVLLLVLAAGWTAAAARDGFAVVAVAPGSGAAPAATIRTGDAVPVPAFEYVYAAPRSPGLQEIHLRVREVDLLRQLPAVRAIDGMFVLPRRLRYVTAECGEFGAFYRPGDAEVVLCYETLRTLYERGQAHQRALGLDDGHPLRYVRANVRFIVLHETGHALVHLLDLPITGRQEDAVDQLAAILMLRFSGREETPEEVIGELRMAANWMLSRSTGAYNLDAYADEHALGEQRYFNLQCLIYGTDPAGFAGMVETGDLTAARARGCARETRLVSRAWLRLLLPHLAPGHELYAEEAARYLRESALAAPPHSR
ncbi:DUF4344 domain-containing metallopeptidase [Luteimonas sp. SDU101]|uniref:DUF4344 domain-containing metallopeptidase n=1 Tax=Luteimonas sp. SDU101 TaxID=3422593 RepID=UPI003EB822AC